MDESILISIKKLLGIAEEDTSFDTDVIMHINSILSICTQLGVGEKNFKIEDETSKWEDFIDTYTQMDVVRSYIYIRVRLLFDPPTNSFLVDSLKKQADEFEWRLTVMSDEENSIYED